METKLINQASLKLDYPTTKKLDASTKAIVASLGNSDSVTISNNQESLTIDSLSLVNRKVYDSVGQKNYSANLSQKDLVEVNKKFLEKANQLNNGIEPSTAQDKSYFNAENTADRIYNFATSFYETYLAGTGKEDSEASRKEYKDIIGSAIDEGFGQALSILGDLPDGVSKEVQSTYDLIFEKLDRFVSGEEQTYSQKVTDKITDKVKEIDRDKSGDLSVEETNLSADYFNELDNDKNGKLTIEEIVSEFKKLDQSKDLSDDLVNSILNNSKSFKEVAVEAEKLAKSTSISYDFLVKNPKVAQAVISFSGAGADASFTNYLEKHPEAVKKILEDPSRLSDVIRDYKLDTILNELQGNPISKDFLEKHDSELENLYNNPKLLEYFKNNKDASTRLVDTLTAEETK